MRGCYIRVSLEAFLNGIGLRHASGIQLHGVMSNPHYNAFDLFLTSEDNPDMPELHGGDKFPEADIVCETVQSKIVVRKAPK